MDALIEPSLQTNFPPLQWLIPPFLPLQVVFLPSQAWTIGLMQLLRRLK
ncbi:hypothetical protein [Moraxella catarrhalis]|nr:hypothetical protein [Moraxella catarrhalis]ADG60349.1 hypothetical protein MCR_0075 [Moraxella catarrhalis BBH18]AZQ88856.1 hypothetical protein EJK50_0077 [Moraxella catarrhalis]